MADVEDQITQATLSTVNTTSTILSQVEERASTLKTQHQLIATQFFDTIAQDLTQRTNVTTQNLTQMVQQTIHEINMELDMFEQGVSEGFEGFATLALEKIQEIKTSAKIETDDTAITNLTVEAADAITTLLQDTEQMYLFYSRYLTSVLENKLQNTTDRMSALLRSQPRFVASRSIDRINLCYNVCSQNTKTSQLLKSILNTMDAIGQTTDVINGLKAIHKSDKHSALKMSQSKLALAEAMESGRRSLDQLLEADLCYLGTAVRQVVQQRHGLLRQALLVNLSMAVENLSTKWDSITSHFQIIRGTQRLRMAKDLLEAVQSMMDALNEKARSHGKNEQLENLILVKSSMMEQFDNITSKVNTIFENSQHFTSESLHNYLKFTIDRQLAKLPTLSVQNFIPDDLCPLAMNYQSYIAFTVNSAMGRNDPDIVDELLSMSETSVEDFDSPQQLALPDDTGIIMIVELDDSSEESAESKVIANFPEGDGGKSAPVESSEESIEQNIPAVVRDLLNMAQGQATDTTDTKAQEATSLNK